MPKNSVTDPITDQEITFAHLILSGTMNDPQAAEAAGLNPTTAAYTKSKPRVREYMDQHRAAVNKKLIDEEAERLRKGNLARDQIRNQILDRLWELAILSPEVTKGSIAGQVKAMAMIVAIEGLIPDRRSPARNQNASPAVTAQMHVSAAMQRPPAADLEPDESVTAVEAHPTTPPLQKRPANHAPANDDHGHTSQINPFIYLKTVSWDPNAMGLVFDAHTNLTSPLRLALAHGKQSFSRAR